MFREQQRNQLGWGGSKQGEMKEMELREVSRGQVICRPLQCLQHFLELGIHWKVFEPKVLCDQMHKKKLLGEFLGPVVRTLHFHYRGTGVIPGWGTQIPYAEWCGQKNNLKKTSDCFVENRGEVSRKSRLSRTWI